MSDMPEPGLLLVEWAHDLDRYSFFTSGDIGDDARAALINAICAGGYFNVTVEDGKVVLRQRD